MSQEFTFNPLLTQLQRRSSLWVPHCGASPAPSASALGTRPAGRPGALGSDACDACRASGPVAGAPHGAAPRLTTTVCVRRPYPGFSSPGRTADLAPVLQRPERGHTPAGASEILVPQSKGLATGSPHPPALRLEPPVPSVTHSRAPPPRSRPAPRCAGTFPAARTSPSSVSDLPSPSCTAPSFPQSHFRSPRSEAMPAAFVFSRSRRCCWLFVRVARDSHQLALLGGVWYPPN